MLYQRKPRKSIRVIIRTRRIMTSVPVVKRPLAVVVVVVKALSRVGSVFLVEQSNVVARHHVDFGEQVRVGLAAERF